MPRIELTQVVKAPREKVFQAFTDYESYPKWQTFFTRVTVTKRDGNTVYFDAEVMLRGRKARRTEKNVLTPPEQVLVEGEVEGITNTSVWKFEPVPEGTRLTLVMDGRLPLRLRILGPFVMRQFRRLLREWVQQFANYVENQ